MLVSPLRSCSISAWVSGEIARARERAGGVGACCGGQGNLGRLLAEGYADPVTLRWVRHVELSAYLGQRVAGNPKALPEMDEGCFPHEGVELASGKLRRRPGWGSSGHEALLDLQIAARIWVCFFPREPMAKSA